MSDNEPTDNPPHNSRNKKGFFSFILNQLFHAEIKHRDDLLEIIRDSAQNELIDPDTRHMLEGVMDIAQQRIRDIMIPRVQMVTLRADQSLDECLTIILESAHSRFPVFNQDKEQIEGILMAKDLLPFIQTGKAQFCLTELLRPAMVVPESKHVDRMLKEFRAKRYHMAIVVDEFGGVSGLVTIENILELIVGEIDDEYDDEEVENIQKLNKLTYNVDALTPIADFNEIFNTTFSDEEVDTIGGLIMQKLGHLPACGEKVEIDNFQFKITGANTRRILQLHVRVPEDAPPVSLT